MHKPSSLKSIVIILIVVAVAFIAYFYYHSDSSSTSTSLLTSTTNQPASNIGQQVLGLLGQIQSLRIDSTLFTDPGYQTLRDYSVQIAPENVGRTNPFAPLPGAPTSPTGSAAGH